MALGHCGNFTIRSHLLTLVNMTNFEQYILIEFVLESDITDAVSHPYVMISDKITH